MIGRSGRFVGLGVLVSLVAGFIGSESRAAAVEPADLSVAVTDSPDPVVVGAPVS